MGAGKEYSYKMMHHEIFDTYSIVKRLTKSGLKEVQAKEIVDAISEGRETELGHLATKADLSALRSDLFAVKSDLSIEIEKVRREIDKNHNDGIKWTIGINIATISILAALFKLFVQ